MLKIAYLSWLIRHEAAHIKELEVNGWAYEETKPYRDKLAALRVELAHTRPAFDWADRIVMLAAALALIIWGAIELWR